MVLSTKNKELAILGKTVSETRGKIIEFFDAFERGGIKGQDGIIDTFFSKSNKSPLTSELLETFESFKDKFNSTSLSADVLKEKFGEIDQTIIDYAKTCKNGEMTTRGFKESVEGMSLSAKAGKAALQALTTVGNMVVFTLISKGLALLVNGFDRWIHKVERSKEAMNNAVSNYESAKSSLKSINSELSEQQKKIDGLLAKDKLTYAEKDELNNLKLITKELLIQQDIVQKRADKASKEAANKAVDSFKKQYGKYDNTKKRIGEVLSDNEFPVPEGTDDIAGTIAAYARAKKLLNQSEHEYYNAIKNGSDTTWVYDDVQYYINIVDNLSESLDESVSGLFMKAENQNYLQFISNSELKSDT